MNIRQVLINSLLWIPVLAGMASAQSGPASIWRDPLFAIGSDRYSMNTATFMATGGTAFQWNVQSAQAGTEGTKTLDLRKRTITTASLFVPMVMSGYLLAQQGKPINSLVLTVHKLSSVGDLYLLNRTLLEMKKAGPLPGTVKTAAVAMNTCFLATIVTGSLLTVVDELPPAVKTIHHTSPWLTMISTGALLYFLNRDNQVHGGVVG